MKIVTVNIPESYLEAIEHLLDNKKYKGGLYPSRSELIRVAVRDWLIKELKRAEEHITASEKLMNDFEDEKKGIVRVPIEKIDENGESIREFKTYKIVRRLEY